MGGVMRWNQARFSNFHKLRRNHPLRLSPPLSVPITVITPKQAQSRFWSSLLKKKLQPACPVALEVHRKEMTLRPLPLRAQNDPCSLTCIQAKLCPPVDTAKSVYNKTGNAWLFYGGKLSESISRYQCSLMNVTWKKIIICIRNSLTVAWPNKLNMCYH